VAINTFLHNQSLKTKKQTFRALFPIYKKMMLSWDICFWQSLTNTTSCLKYQVGYE